MSGEILAEQENPEWPRSSYDLGFGVALQKMRCMFERFCRNNDRQLHDAKFKES